MRRPQHVCILVASRFWSKLDARSVYGTPHVLDDTSRTRPFPARSPVPDSTEHARPTGHVRFARRVKLFAMLARCLTSMPRLGKRPIRTQRGMRGNARG